MGDLNKEILVIPASSPVSDTRGGKGLFGAAPGPVSLNTDLLKENIASFVETVNEMLSSIPKITEPFQLDEIELSIEINAEGNIQLIGGLKVGAAGGITLRMKR